MGETDEVWAAGYAACARGEPLFLGIDGWNGERSRFADGWLKCLAESAVAHATNATNAAKDEH